MKHLNEYIIEQQQIDEGKLWDKIVKGFKSFWNWLSGDIKDNDVKNFRDYDFDFTKSDKYNKGNIEFKPITISGIKELLKTRSDMKSKKGFYQVENDVNLYQQYLNSKTLKCVCIVYDKNVAAGICVFDYQPSDFRTSVGDDSHDNCIHIYTAQIKKDFVNEKLFDWLIEMLVKNVKSDENLRGITASCSTNDMMKAYAKYGFKKYADNLVELIVKK